MEHECKQPNNALFEIGFVNQKGAWKLELANKVGLGIDQIDWSVVENSILESMETGNAFRGRDGKKTTKDGAAFLLLSTGITTIETQETIFAKFNRGKPGGRFEWMGVAFLTENEFMLQNQIPLYRFAWFADKNWLVKLAKTAAPEPWTLKSSARDYDVLFKYVRYTFEKLEEDGQIVEVKDGSAAAFHTGLYTSDYEPVYAYFVRNRNVGQQKWEFDGFYSPNEGRAGKDMSRNLSKAKTANWFKTPARLFCNPNHLAQDHLSIRYDHCVIENASRLPLWLIKRVTQDSSIISALSAVYEDENSKRLAVTAAIKASHDYKNILAGLSSWLDRAILLARKKVICDYTAAVPQFYPDHNPDNDGFGFLLPLSFDMTTPNEVQCALVIQPTKDEHGYNAETILTPDMAYSNARLLRRPSEHWLTDRLKNDLPIQ